MTALYEEQNALLEDAQAPVDHEQSSDEQMPLDTPAAEEEETAPEEETQTDAEVDYARLAADDLAEIKRLDPAYAPAAHLGELPFARRFAQLRDLGLSVKEALAAAAPRFDRTDGRAHLRAVAPHGAKAVPEGLHGRDMQNARELFGGLSDSEINALYRRVSKKND